MKQILNGSLIFAVFLHAAALTSTATGQTIDTPATNKLPKTIATQAIQTIPKAIPEAIITTWTLFGVDPDLTKKLAPEISKARTELIKKWANLDRTATTTPPQGSLAEFAIRAKRKIPPLLQSFADEILVSPKEQPPTVNSSYVYAPALCKLGNRYVIHVGAADTIHGTLIDAVHTSVDARQLENTVTTNGNDPTEKTDLSGLTRQLINRIDTTTAIKRSQQQEPSALHIGLSLAREQTRRDEGSAFCAQILLAEKLLRKGYTVVRPWGNEDLGKIRNTLGLPATLRRPTRTLVMLWDLPKFAPNQSVPKTTMTMKSSIQLTESVLGQPLPKLPDITWQGKIAPTGEIDITPSNSDLDSFLTRERKALSLKEAPQVAKIKRGWVYLDKGRAYGLRMNDRLVVSDGPPNYSAAIKGHVVGFYGPEKKITSPRGFLVHEGAIVFIRKGQAQTKIGQTFIYDETTFPTKYPAGGR